MRAYLARLAPRALRITPDRPLPPGYGQSHWGTQARWCYGCNKPHYDALVRVCYRRPWHLLMRLCRCLPLFREVWRVQGSRQAPAQTPHREIQVKVLQAKIVRRP